MSGLKETLSRIQEYSSAGKVSIDGTHPMYQDVFHSNSASRRFLRYSEPDQENLMPFVKVMTRSDVFTDEGEYQSDLTLHPVISPQTLAQIANSWNTANVDLVQKIFVENCPNIRVAMDEFSLSLGDANVFSVELDDYEGFSQIFESPIVEKTRDTDDGKDWYLIPSRFNNKPDGRVLPFRIGIGLKTTDLESLYLQMLNVAVDWNCPISKIDEIAELRVDAVSTD